MYEGLAEIYHKHNVNKKLAVKCYEKAMEQNEENLKLLWSYAEILSEPEVLNIPLSRDLVEKALNLDRQSLMQDQNIKVARKIYERIIEVDKEEVNARINLGKFIDD